MTGAVFDQGAVSQQLSGVGSGLSPLDSFYGKMLAVPDRYRCSVGQVMTDNGETTYFDQGRVTAKQWFGWNRQNIIDGLFGPFLAVNTDPNCIEPLGGIRALQTEIQAAGGAATETQKTQILGLLHGVSQWLQQQELSMSDAFSAFNSEYRQVGVISGQLSDATSLARAWGLTDWINLFDDLVATDKVLVPPVYTLSQSWQELIQLVDGVAGEIKDAETRDFGSLLMKLDLGGATREWPQLCDLAATLKPSSNFTIPPPPAGFPAT